MAWFVRSLSAYVHILVAEAAGEKYSAPLATSFNGERPPIVVFTRVDGRDVAEFVACVLTQSAVCGCADFDGDGAAGINDMSQFAGSLVTQ